MARSRMIKPEFWSDEKIGELSYIERLLFIGMWTFADDEGLIKAHPSYLKANIFPYDDALKPDAIDKALSNFESKNMIFRYTQNGQKYLWIIKFRVYQRIDKPQKPTNPLPSIQNGNFARAIFKRDNFICHICKSEVDPGAKLNDANSSTPSLDHIIPQSKGGSHAPSNLATACISCNKRRGNNDIITFQEDSENIPRILTDEVNRSKENINTLVGDKSTDPCPHQEILSLYKKNLPMLTQHTEWGEDRQKLLRERWRTSKELQDLDWWDQFFSYIAQNCPFLTGDNNRNWSADLPWILQRKHFTEIREGKYYKGDK